jgi:hypothetical protein
VFTLYNIRAGEYDGVSDGRGVMHVVEKGSPHFVAVAITNIDQNLRSESGEYASM